jgi:hypothetical protein
MTQELFNVTKRKQQILIFFFTTVRQKKRLTFCAQAARAFTFFVHEIKIIRRSRFTLRSNSTAKKSKQILR